MGKRTSITNYRGQLMTRGGKREGAGRPKGSGKPEEEKTKKYSFRLYIWEVEKVREFIKKLRA